MDKSSDFDINLPRYMRIFNFVASKEANLVVQRLNEVGSNCEKVSWLENLNCFALSKIINRNFFKAGLVQYIDAASCFVAEVLEPQENDSILDVCCAPCGKFSILADMMNFRGDLVGIDVSHKRLEVSTSLLCKRNLCDSRKSGWNCHVLKADASLFNPTDPSTFELFWSTNFDKFLRENSKGYLNKKRKRKQQELSLLAEKYGFGCQSLSRSCKRHLKTLRATKLGKSELCIENFYKILVDVECSTDGYVKKHRTKEQLSKQLSAEREDKLVELQKSILLNSFNLLKMNGFLVYSTCSFSQKQNEDIIIWLKSKHNFEIVNLREKYPRVPADESKILKGALLFSPNKSKTNGMFVCKLQKVK